MIGKTRQKLDYFVSSHPVNYKDADVRINS